MNRSVELLEDARVIEPVAQCDELRVLGEMREASPWGGTRQEGIDDEDIRRDDRGDVLPLTTVVIEEVDDLGFIVEELAQLSLQPRSDDGGRLCDSYLDRRDHGIYQLGWGRVERVLGL